MSDHRDPARVMSNGSIMSNGNINPINRDPRYALPDLSTEVATLFERFSALLKSTPQARSSTSAQPADELTVHQSRLALQFIRYTVNCTSRDSVSHLLTHLVVYIIARCSSLNTTTFCLFPVCPVLPHPTVMSPDSVKYAAAATHRMAS